MAGMTLYRIVSPSGKSYVGITSMGVRRRWIAHVGAAKRNPKKHPLRDAIRKYGRDAFVVAVIAEGLTEADAKSLEIAYIDIYQSNIPGKGYNVSAGGDCDGRTGSVAAWAAINQSAESRQTYLRKLSERKKSGDWTDYKALRAAADEWRRKNPEQAAMRDAAGAAALAKWGQRNKDIADVHRRSSLRTARDVIAANPEYHLRRLSAGILASFRQPQRLEAHRQMVVSVWAARDTEQRADIASKISASAVARYAGMSDDDRNRAKKQLEEARKNIDHEKRKRNQKAALAAYWTPERRAEASAKRRGRSPRDKKT